MVSRINRGPKAEQKGAELQPLSHEALQSFVTLESAQKGDPASQLFQRLSAFQQALFDEAPIQPKILIVADIVCKLSRLLADAHVIHAAVRQAPRRNISGPRGAVEYLGGAWARSSVYKLIHCSLGIQDIDTLRLSRDMDEVIAISPHLTHLIQETAEYYQKLVRSKCPQLPPLYEAS